MRIILRIFAIVIWCEIIRTIVFIWRFSRLGGLAALMRGIFGATTIIGWLLILAVGPFAATQLWRLRESGRKASLLLAVYAFSYYLAGVLFFREPGAELSPILVAVAGNALFSALLLSPPARRACLASKADGVSR
ncbi:MAG: hypothetical protein ABSE35_22595 [Bryobacteraceae bacterium]|jgi:hypothetical protein